MSVGIASRTVNRTRESICNSRESRLKVLLIEDDAGDAELIQEMLSKGDGRSFDVIRVDRLSSGVKRLAEGGINVVLLDLSLPDNRGLDTFFCVHKQAPCVPVVVLTGLDDEEIAIKAVSAGAQDYLVKGDVNGNLLVRSLRYAIERSRAEIALRKSEERYRVLVETAPEIIFSVSAEGIVTSINKAFETITGLPRHEWVNRPVEELVCDHDRESVAESISQALQGEAGFNIEACLPSAHGENPVVEVIGTALREEDKAIELICCARDITERKKIEQMKRDFVSCASHQLKTPVGMIRGYVEILLSGLAGDLTPKQRAWLEKVAEINSKNYRLISDLLNVSRIERGVISVEARAVNLRKVVDLALVDYGETIAGKGLSLKIEQPDEDIMVMADIDKMVEALSNVIHNAIKFTDRGGIAVKLKRDTQSGIVEVVDTGHGMSAETLSKIFTRDQILSGSPTPEYSSGLGLYISKEFMRIQRGDVSASSVEGIGSSFVFHIPLADEQPQY